MSRYYPKIHILLTQSQWYWDQNFLWWYKIEVLPAVTSEKFSLNKFKKGNIDVHATSRMTNHIFFTKLQKITILYITILQMDIVPSSSLVLLLLYIVAKKEARKGITRAGLWWVPRQASIQKTIFTKN